MRGADGKIQIRGLQPGQQLTWLGDGRFTIVQTTSSTQAAAAAVAAGGAALATATAVIAAATPTAAAATDEVVRSAIVKIGSSEIHRPATEIYPLDVE